MFWVWRWRFLILSGVYFFHGARTLHRPRQAFKISWCQRRTPSWLPGVSAGTGEGGEGQEDDVARLLDTKSHRSWWFSSKFLYRCGVIRLVQSECDSGWENAPATMSFMMFRYFSCILGDLNAIYIASYSTWSGSLSLGYGIPQSLHTKIFRSAFKKCKYPEFMVLAQGQYIGHLMDLVWWQPLKKADKMRHVFPLSHVLKGFRSSNGPGNKFLVFWTVCHFAGYECWILPDLSERVVIADGEVVRDRLLKAYAPWLKGFFQLYTRWFNVFLYRNWRPLNL